MKIFVLAMATAALAFIQPQENKKLALIEASLQAEVPRILCLNENIATGAQPAAPAFAKLRANGFRAVLSLRTGAEGVDLKKDRELTEAAGMRYIHIPVVTRAPDLQRVEEFIRAVKDKNNHPMLVYCGSANRVGAFWMIYRVVEDGWPEEKALEEAVKIGLTRPELKAFVRVYLTQHRWPALSSLVDAERAFARASVEKGIRASFLEFFADEAIVFQPHPVKYKEAVKDSPAPLDPLAVTLNWEPIFSDISAAGDMGYNTGPYTLMDNSPAQRPPQHGFFFSVWKKQADGNWKVVLDVGIQTNEAHPGSRELKTGRVIQKEANPAKVNVEAARASLLKAERDFLKAAQTDGIVKAFSKYSAQDPRLHRNGAQPILGEAEIVTFLAKASFTPTWEPMFVDVAQSGDLGYTYGSYELKESNPPNAITEKGYYARVWRRGANNKWGVVLDTSSPLPQEQK